jgi:glycosyltransferase involved in cell wall biosynthesis
MQRVAAFTLNRADVLRAISGFTRAQLERWRPGLPCIQFPTWTDIGPFNEAGQRRTGASQDVLYAGVLTPLKGVHHLIAAFGRLSCDFPAPRLILAGKPEDVRYVRKLEAAVREWKLEGRVQFVGPVTQPVLAVLMQDAGMFVLPSHLEGLGRVVLEAMVVGLPVVASPVGGIPELIQGGTTGLFAAPGDEVGLAAQIRWVLEHPREAAAMGRRARVFAEGVFSPDSYREGYRHVMRLAGEALADGH